MEVTLHLDEQLAAVVPPVLTVPPEPVVPPLLLVPPELVEPPVPVFPPEAWLLPPVPVEPPDELPPAAPVLDDPEEQATNPNMNKPMVFANPCDVRKMVPLDLRQLVRACRKRRVHGDTDVERPIARVA